MRDARLLHQLANQPWFIVWKLIQRPGEPKPAKVPIWPHTGHACNWMDPAARMLPADALAWAQHLGEGHGVGIVLTPGCGLVAIDIDGARAANGGWFPHVLAFESLFPGAYTETSISGQGRHIIARVAHELLPAHGTRNSEFRCEAYSRDRFIALTGLEAAGGLEVDHTAAAQRFLAAYFPPPEAERSTDWREGPVEAWDGPTDDNELIRRACASAGARAAWGKSAPFLDLWQGTPEVLERLFPPQSLGKSFDASAAALALYNHLAFWTGNDCPRMLRLFQQSALGGTKHGQNEYHFRRAILAACASQTEWYSGGGATRAGCAPGMSLAGGTDPQEPQRVTAERNESAPAASHVTVEIAGLPRESQPSDSSGSALVLRAAQSGELPPPGTYLNITWAKQLFTGCVHVEDVDRIQTPTGFLLTKEQFDGANGGLWWPMEADGSKPTESAWTSFLYNKLHRFPRVRGQYFGPRDPAGHIRRNVDGSTEINSYIPLNIRRVAGDPTPFIQHVQRLLPHDWELMIETLAARVQFQGIKFMWAPFLQGTKGNGKTLLAKILEYCIGQRYTHWPKADQLDEKYNSMFVGAILVIVDEMEKFPLDIEPVLNSMVTATRMEIRAMRTDKVMRDVCFNPLFISNDQTSLRCDPDQRRYAPFFCAQQHKADLRRDGLTPEYFRWFRDWLENRDGYAITAEYLSTLPLRAEAGPDFTIRAPDTTSTQTAYGASRTAAEQELVHAIEQNREGFRGGWMSSHAVDMEFARSGRARSMSLNARRAVIDALGYIPHPSLPDGGFCAATMPDGNKYRLYVREGHPWAVSGLTAEQVRDGYLAAQRLV